MNAKKNTGAYRMLSEGLSRETDGKQKRAHWSVQ